jgi:hypothetical protein
VTLPTVVHDLPVAVDRVAECESQGGVETTLRHSGRASPIGDAGVQQPGQQRRDDPRSVAGLSQRRHRFVAFGGICHGFGPDISAWSSRGASASTGSWSCAPRFGISVGAANREGVRNELMRRLRRILQQPYLQP